MEARRDLYEQNQDLKNRNKQTIDKLKARNDKLKQELSEKQDQLTNPCDVSDLNALEKELHLWRRKLDEQKNKTEKKRQNVQVLQERHTDCMKQLQVDGKPGLSEEPQLKQMRILENRLDKLMIKNNEAASIQKTYSVILRKFQEEKAEYEL